MVPDAVHSVHYPIRWKQAVSNAPGLCNEEKGGGIFAWGNPEEFGDVSKNENDYIMVCRLL